MSKTQGLRRDGSTDVITSQEHNDVIIRPDPAINDSFAKNINEILEMLDRESAVQDQEQEVDKGHEAAEPPRSREQWSRVILRARTRPVQVTRDALG